MPPAVRKELDDLRSRLESLERRLGALNEVQGRVNRLSDEMHAQPPARRFGDLFRRRQ